MRRILPALAPITMRTSAMTPPESTYQGWKNMVLISALCVALGLSSDTPEFAADGLTDLTTIDLSFLGPSPSFLGYLASSKFSANQFFW